MKGRSLFLFLAVLSALSVLVACFLFARQAHASVEAQTAQAASRYLAGLRGQVLDQATGQPIPAAHIRALELGLDLTSDSAGSFDWPAIALPLPQRAVTVSVTAPGYGEWRMQNVYLAAGDTIILTPHLQERPVTHSLPPSGLFGLPELSAQEQRDFQAFLAATETLTLPATIRLRLPADNWRCSLTVPYTIEVVDFNFYIKHVLPTEWHPDTPGREWSEESYRAGAMAIKTYAWYWINRGGKWDDADLYGSVCDQAYNPEYARQATDRAVDFTWDWRLTRSGRLFQAYHKHSDLYDCSPGFCLSQVGSQELALDGYAWNEILLFYYSGAEVWYLEPSASPPPPCDPLAPRSALRPAARIHLPRLPPPKCRSAGRPWWPRCQPRPPPRPPRRPPGSASPPPRPLRPSLPPPPCPIRARLGLPTATCPSLSASPSAPSACWAAWQPYGRPAAAVIRIV